MASVIVFFLIGQTLVGDEIEAVVGERTRQLNERGEAGIRTVSFDALEGGDPDAQVLG